MTVINKESTDTVKWRERIDIDHQPKQLFHRARYRLDYLSTYGNLNMNGARLTRAGRNAHMFVVEWQLSR